MKSRLILALGLLVPWSAISAFAKEESASVSDGTPHPKPVLLSDTGGDRATAYLMSNKIARRGETLVVTWLDVDRQNHVAEVDSRTGRILKSTAIGKRLTDNHCGGAITTGKDGTLYLVTGAHHGPCELFQLQPDGKDWIAGNGGVPIIPNGTYPSLVCDVGGNLHVTYRREGRGTVPTIMYARCLQGGKWSPPVELVQIAVPEHTWTTHSLEAGPDGQLHLVFSNVLPYPEAGSEGRYYGASHLYSVDSGTNWRQLDDGKKLALPISAAKLNRIEGNTLEPQRTEASYRGPRNQFNPYYHRVMLSNVAVDSQGHPLVVVHNQLNGTARAYRHTDSQGWHSLDLTDPVTERFPGYAIRHSSQIGLREDDRVEIVLTISHQNDKGWGGKSSEIVRVQLDPELKQVLSIEEVYPSGDADQHWLPSLERRSYNAAFCNPALLFMRGANAGGHDKNVNAVETGVWLELQ